MKNYPYFVLITSGRFTSDGAGVRLKRILPIFKNYREIFEVNPFLLLDEFKSENENDYRNGFPLHPHRGFQTITYMKWGSFEHKDSLGNSGIIKEGGIQWMIAGSGIQHSEMPIINQDKRIWGYQLWFNLPKQYKYIDPYYKNIQKEELPLLNLNEGIIKILFGKTNYSEEKGIQNPYWKLNYYDVTIYPEQSLYFNHQVIDIEDWIICYVYQNEIHLNIKLNHKETFYKLEENQLIILEKGNILEIKNVSNKPSQFLFMNSTKLNEPIVRYGPFVMNTEKEILDAIHQFS